MNAQGFVVVYPARGLMGAIAVVVEFPERGVGVHRSAEAAEAVRAAVAERGATERARFDLARVVPAYRSIGVLIARPAQRPADWPAGGDLAAL